MVADLKSKRRKTMMHTDTFSICESIDAGWDDDSDIRDLIQTTPLVFDADGLPVGYQASQLFGLEAAYLVGRA
jgi:NAD(P)H-hydrate repair Nnr-like enzyme with NAD(P)H-hydrate dehydratase domain